MKHLDKLPTLKFIICMDKLTDDLKAKFEGKNVQLLYIYDICLDSADTVADPPVPSDLATICYSSGTTGLPVS